MIKSDKQFLESKIGKGCPLGVKIGGIMFCPQAGAGCRIAGWEKICGAPDIQRSLTLTMRILIHAQSWFRN